MSTIEVECLSPVRQRGELEHDEAINETEAEIVGGRPGLPGRLGRCESLDFVDLSPLLFNYALDFTLFSAGTGPTGQPTLHSTVWSATRTLHFFGHSCSFLPKRPLHRSGDAGPLPRVTRCKVHSATRRPEHHSQKTQRREHGPDRSRSGTDPVPRAI